MSDLKEPASKLLLGIVKDGRRWIDRALPCRNVSWSTNRFMMVGQSERAVSSMMTVTETDPPLHGTFVIITKSVQVLPVQTHAIRGCDSIGLLGCIRRAGL